MNTDLITIESEALHATINPLGAELSSLTDPLGHELLTDADPRWWTGHAPLLFPFVGRSRGDVYRLGGKAYPMPQHGFARQATFAIIEQHSDNVIFRLSANAETQAIYPFSFELDMQFAVEGPKLFMTATVRNIGADVMPFSFGFHPAFAWPLPFGGSVEEHLIEFEADEPASIRTVGQEAGLIARETVLSPAKGKILAPNYALFAKDALIWDQLQSRSLYWGVPNHRRLKIDFPDTPWLGIWQKPEAHYLCIEPWAGMADLVGFDGDVWEKQGVMALPAGEERAFRMNVAIVDD